jgi:hypothetical protein
MKQVHHADIERETGPSDSQSRGATVN